MSDPLYEPRSLARTGLRVTPVALGCWPMAGVTSLGATHADGVATVLAAIDSGVNHLDTAYVYGPEGESDRILAEALVERRDRVVLASKVGIHYEEGVMVTDGRPDTLREECDTLLARIGVDAVDLLYLHSPDPDVPVAESAGAIAELITQGKARTAGASNCSLGQIKEFADSCPLAAVQLPYSMLQRGIEQETLPWCREQGVSVFTYWSLMKGLLSGRLSRDHQFDEADGRKNYPMYQGEEWRRNQDFVDDLRQAAELTGVSVGQLVVNWTFTRSGVTSVLCGAKRPWQIEETARAMDFELTDEQLQRIDEALERRGHAASKREFK